MDSLEYTIEILKHQGKEKCYIKPELWDQVDTTKFKKAGQTVVDTSIKLYIKQQTWMY